MTVEESLVPVHSNRVVRALIMRRIVVPQAMRRVLPEALNNCVSLLKATSIVSLIAVPDLMYQPA